jgi:hypothetical protein
MKGRRGNDREAMPFINPHEVQNTRSLQGTKLWVGKGRMWRAVDKCEGSGIYNNLLTASGLSPGGSGYFTFKLRHTY